MPNARPLAFFAFLAAALGCGDDPADPSPVGALPIEWHFDSGLDGWASGAAGTAVNGGSVAVANGEVALTGWGDPGEPDAWITRAVELPAAAYTIRVRAIADCIPQDGGGDSSLRVRIDAGGTTATLLDWVTVGDQAYGTFSADLDAYAGQSVTLRVEMSDEGEQEDGPDEFESVCVDEISIIGD